MAKPCHAYLVEVSSKTKKKQTKLIKTDVKTYLYEKQYLIHTFHIFICILK